MVEYKFLVDYKGIFGKITRNLGFQTKIKRQTCLINETNLLVSILTH